jgi:alkylhydroperoxidase family enzyme
MPRLPLLPTDTDNAQLAELFDWVRAQGVEVPALYRVIGNEPTLLKAWIAFAWSLRLDARTPRALRELLIMRGAQLQVVAYEWAHHWPMAVTAGVSEDQLRALATWQTSELFDDDERLVLQLADEVAGGTGGSEETMASLRARFGDAAAVELTLTASFYVCVARFLNSIDLELEPDYEHYVDEAFAPF